MKKRFQLLVLSVLCVAFARAQYVAPSEGVFRIVNVAYNAALMENYENNNLRCTSTIGDENDFDQLWILKKVGSGYSIQNAYTGAYIQTGNTGTEVPYWTGETPKEFKISAGGSKKGYNIFDPNLNGQGLHSKGGNGNVVRWVDCEASEWQFAAVEISEEAMGLAQAEYAEYLQQKIAFESRYEELQANLAKFDAALAKYFEDAACTILKEEFASAEEADLIAAMTADSLPAELVAMAVKVKSDKWAEPNEKAEKPGWDSIYPKKFRVQMIEPYSIAGEITEWIGHQGHSNMDNPTGLYANNHQVLYIMVSDTIKEGAELWATWLVGHSKMPNYNNGYGNSGVRLKKGLNIVPIRNNGSALYFNYLVHTYDKDRRKFTNKLSNYDDIKIHVEGGYINGYYNVVGDALYTPDNDDDWVYYEDRANLENITILGRYEVLQFELNDVIDYTDDKGNTWSEKGLAYHFPERLPTSMPNSPAFTAPNQRINGIVEAWDRIFLSEKLTLGVASKAEADSANKLFPRYNGTWTEKAEIYNYDAALDAFCDSIKDRDGDYGEYYNHHGLAFGTRTGYMYGSWDHSGYHINTTPSILTCIATEAGPTWGPAHEIGHQHQALYTLNGEMEVTNNTFANVAAWYMGMGTSRVNGTEGNLAHVYDNFKNGGYLLSNNIWALTQRYYRLWLYYHRAGNNTQFFPRLFELIRQKPMERSYGSGSEMQRNEKTGEMESVSFQLTNGYRSYLHFYQLCCEAAQEDLTEFFRAYGCFVPVDGVFQGDYTNSKYYTTQEEIDKAIAEVKAKGYPVNNKVLFINDCTDRVTYGHDGRTRREFWDGETGGGANAEVGLYVDYLKGTPVSGEYIYTLENLKLSISGGYGAVGFAIYNKEGEIQAFSNNHSFSLNKKTAALLRSGEGTLYAVAADGNDVVIKNKILVEPVETQLAELQKAYELAVSYLERTDTTGRKVGYLIPDSVQDFSSLVVQVENVIKNEDTSAHTYGEWYLMMDAAIVTVQNSAKVRVPFIPYSFYSLFLTSSDVVRYMDNANAGLRFIENKEEGLADNLQWKLVATEAGDSYYIQHRATGKFITTIKSGQRVKAESTDVTKAVAFNLVPDLPGSFLLQCVNDENLYLYNYVSNTNNYVYAGNQTGANAKWNIQLEDDLLGMPETSTGDSITIYHLLNTNNGQYAYSYMPNSPRNRGRIATEALNDKDDTNFWFYFKQGSEEGKYTMYNFATKLPVSVSDGNLFTNKEVETAPEYAIELNEQGTGLVISAAEGTWFINDSVEFAVASVNDQTDWKLQRAQTIDVSNATLTSLTMTKERVTLTEGDSIVLTVTTAPEYAADHSVTWSSSDTTIATVDSTGMVKAIAAGSATITATANDASGLTATCKITVKKGEAGIFNTATSTMSVQSRGGLIIIDGLAEGTEVAVYSVVGKQIAAITTTGGTTTIDTGLAKGSTIIVKVGGDNFKVSIQ